MPPYHISTIPLGTVAKTIGVLPWIVDSPSLIDDLLEDNSADNQLMLFGELSGRLLPLPARLLVES